jgi:hypothetical protein
MAGGLETEKHELELELDRAKRAAEAGGGNGAVCSAAVERIKDRFQKVKKELDDMRDERKKKENAYRLMQKESKQCEAENAASSSSPATDTRTHGGVEQRV